MIRKLQKKYPEMKSWRKEKDWRRAMKKLSRALGRVCSIGGKNKEVRIKIVTENYLKKAKSLYLKLEKEKDHLPMNDVIDLFTIYSLEDFMKLLTKHIDLVDRRLLKGEKIPNEEKLFSIFEDYTEWITKGKKRPSVELGKKLSITTDQYGLIVDYEIMEKQSDSQIVPALVARMIPKYKVDIWSFDKGYWHKENKAILQHCVRRVVMPKKGKCNKAEQEEQNEKEFKKFRNKHSAIESNINELEHRGLDRCLDRSYDHFKRYISLGVISYNLQKIGKELIRLTVKENKQSTKKKSSQAVKAA